MGSVNVPGLVAILLFYLVILAVGIWAGRKKKMSKDNTILAGRSIGLFVGIFTTTATWVGGGYINGTSEAIYTEGFGLVWTQAPWAYSASLIVSGMFFAKIMRERRYTTMIDPFQRKFGKHFGGLLFIPALLAEILWCAAILNALGSTISVVISLDRRPSVIVSAAIAVGYTLLGGLFSVAYTDVIQLICMFIGLWLSVPFVLTNSAVDSITENDSKWVGTWKPSKTGLWIDLGLQMTLGGIPWQAYFQRVLASDSPRTAQIMSYVGGAGCAMFAIPPLLIGAAGKTTDWSQTAFYDGVGANTTVPINPSLILPMALQYLTPTAVGVIGLGAVSAAVMSSTDSSVLSSSSMFTHNIYNTVFRPMASEREMYWVMRVAIIVVGAIATTLALTIDSIYILFVLCSDLVYVILFPQLLAVIHMDKIVNTYGAAIGYFLAVVLRILGGEPSIGIPVTIKYPLYDEVEGQLFPMRTFTMLCSLVALTVFSVLFKVLFKREVIPMKWDFFHCFDGKMEVASGDEDNKTDETAKNKGTDNMAMDGQVMGLSFQSLQAGNQKGEWGEKKRSQRRGVNGGAPVEGKGVENEGMDGESGGSPRKSMWL